VAVSWHCEVCGHMTVPLTGARHQCRSCCRTVCDRCSTVPLNSVRTCRVCYLREGGGKYAEQRREKYVFLVRHAQSTWNQNVEMVKTFRNCSMEGMSMKAAVRQMGTLVSKEVWHRDHPISEEGLRQTQELRQKIAACQRRARRAGPAVDTNGLGGGSARGGPWCDWDDGGADAAERGLVGCPEVAEQERVRRFYSTFLDTRQQIYCSPLLRALQTAHLVLPSDDGWGRIKLLKDARERFSFILERDCLGTGVGAHIVDRAMQMGQDLPGLRDRVDSSDCAQRWWSEEPESDADVEARLQKLWRRLLEEDVDDSCVLVTHSNLIKALLMRFGGVEEDVLPSPCGRPGPAAAEQAPAEVDEEASGVLFDDGSDASADEGPREGSWQVVGECCDGLRRLKVERLQNCGVLGLRCVRETPARGIFPEVDGWVDISCDGELCRQSVAHPEWIAKDALLMFDSVLVK